MMRVTQRMMTENAVRYMNENTERLQALQEKVASGKQFQRGSDNPSGVSAVLSLRSSLESNKAYLDTVAVTDDWMTATDYSLKQMLTIASRAVNLTLSGVSDTLGPDERKALANEINALLEQGIEVANTSHQNSYIYSGYRTTTKPFSGLDMDGNQTYEDVVFNGNPAAEVILRNVGPGQIIPQNIDGNTYLLPLLKALVNAREALDPNSSLGISTDAALDELNNALKLIQEASTLNGARQRQVRQTKDRLEKAQIEIKSLLSNKEDVNMAEAISALRFQETVYQSVLEVGHRAISALNLFDLLS